MLGEQWKALNADVVYLIGSFPSASCDNIRIRRYRDAAYRGYVPGTLLSATPLLLRARLASHGERH